MGQLLGAEAGAEQEAVRAVRPGGAAEGLSQIPAGVVLRAEVGPDAVFPQPRGGRRANNRKAASAQLPQVDAGLSQPAEEQADAVAAGQHHPVASGAQGPQVECQGQLHHLHGEGVKDLSALLLQIPPQGPGEGLCSGQPDADA